MTPKNNEPSRQDLMDLAQLLRAERPQATKLGLDEAKQRVLRRGGPVRRGPYAIPFRARVTMFSLLALSFSLSATNAAASLKGLLTGKSGGPPGIDPPGRGNQVSLSNDKGGSTQYLFSSFNKSMGGGHSDKSSDKSSDGAATSEYCPSDKGSDDRDKSSNDDSDGDKGKYDDWKRGDSKYKSGFGWSSKGGSDDGDKSSSDHSDENQCEPPPPPPPPNCSDDHDGSSDDGSDGDKAAYASWSKKKTGAAGKGWSNKGSDDGDASSHDSSDGGKGSEKCSDDRDGSSGDHSEHDDKSDDRDGSSDDYSD